MRPINTLKPISMENYQPTSLQHTNHLARQSTIKKPTIYLSAIVVIIIAGVFINNKIQEKRQLESQQFLQKMEEDRKVQVKDNIRSYVKVTDGTYQYSNLGGVFGLNITVINNTSYLLDNVR